MLKVTLWRMLEFRRAQLQNYTASHIMKCSPKINSEFLQKLGRHTARQQN